MGKKKPVTLVASVVPRKSSVQPLMEFALSNPTTTTSPERIPTKLKST
jgi:hypothetical protein